jgi:serine/threonine protein kinase
MATTPLCPSCGKPLAPDAPQGLCQECLLKAGFPTGPDTGGKSPRFVPLNIEEMAGKFPQLEILEFIGQGGMGAVYRARQKQLNRLVALKILPPGIGDDPAFAERFTREAQALAQLNHPGIVTLYEFGQASGLFYFLMEFVDGVNLRQLLRTGRVSAREALAIVPQICDALQFAHDQGLVHRDIKPENILLDRRGRVKVADFGLAKLVGTGSEPTPGVEAADGSAALTESGKIVGTPNYMAPEQVKHPADVDHRADIYALGVVFYQMLTGELPDKKFEPPSRKVQIDVRLDEVVLRALEKDPERRYQHASQVRTDVETIAQSSTQIRREGKPLIRDTINEAEWNNPQNWKSWCYISKRDSRILVPRRIRWMGWTLNFGNPYGVLAMLAIFVILLVASIASKPMGLFTRVPGSSRRPALTVRAYIDGSDVVFVSGYKLWIEHRTGSLPGKLIYVNGQAWTPTWTTNGVSSEFAGLDPAFRPRDPQTIQITNRIGRGTVSVVQFPSADNDQTLAVRIDDEYFGGADWYEFAISWDGSAKPAATAAKPTSKTGAESEIQPVISAAENWLTMVDARDYSGSWKESSAFVQGAITEQRFTNALDTYRNPLGDLLSRKMVSSQRLTQMPGMPDGRYVVMQFETSFANKKSAIETVTFVLENGQWKSASYLIK